MRNHTGAGPSPSGTTRYWSWWFAAPEAKEPLLGAYALLAEWRALMDPAAESRVSHIKLAWWREEIARLAGGTPSHPITQYLSALPRAHATDFARLERSVAAAAAQVAGAPLEHAADLAPHADALYAVPLRVAAALSGAPHDTPGVAGATRAAAAAEYLARALDDHRRDARAGRVSFPVEQLLSAGIDNDDLAADAPSAALLAYRERLRRQAQAYHASAFALLPPGERPALRHLAVLSSLGLRRLEGNRSPAGSDIRLADLYNAWNAARRAAASR